MLTPAEEYELVCKVVDAACKVGNINYLDYISHKKSVKLNSIRNASYLIAWERGVHPRRIANIVHRTRANIINMVGRYLSFRRNRDEITIRAYNNILKELDKSN